MKPSRPSARLTLDGRAWSAAESGLVWLRAWLGLGASHAAVSLAAWPGSPFAGAAAGAALSVALGETGEEEEVWSGEVTELGATANGVHVDGLAATQGLNRERKTRTYLRQSVADIVRDLAASVSIDEVEAPLRLESYAVDDRRPVWEHLLDLAALAGCDLSAAPSGGLRFVPVKSGPAGGLGAALAIALPGASALRYGANVLSFRVARRPAGAASASAAYGAASEKGAERWHWLRHDPVAAPDASAPSRVRGVLRTREGVRAATEAAGERAGRSGVRGEIVTLGRPGVRPGDVVEAQDFPGVEGPFRVLAIEHGFDTRSGFLTRLAVEAAAGAGGGLGALAGGLGL